MANKTKQENFDTSDVLGKFCDSNLLIEQNETLLKFVRDNSEGEFAFYSAKLSNLKGGKELAAVGRNEVVLLVRALTEQLIRIDEIADRFRSLDPKNYNLHHLPSWNRIWGPRVILFLALRDMLKKKLPFEADDVDRLVRWITAAGTTGGSQHYHLITKYSHPVAGVVKAVENLNAQDLLPENSKVHQGACDLLECLRGLENATNMRKSIERLEAAVGAAPESPVLPGRLGRTKHSPISKQAKRIREQRGMLSFHIASVHRRANQLKNGSRLPSR